MADGGGRKGGKKGRKMGRGARNGVRARYWNSKRLEKRKVRNLVRCCGFTPAKALVFWRAARTTRMIKVGI